MRRPTATALEGLLRLHDLFLGRLLELAAPRTGKPQSYSFPLTATPHAWSATRPIFARESSFFPVRLTNSAMNREILA